MSQPADTAPAADMPSFDRAAPPLAAPRTSPPPSPRPKRRDGWRDLLPDVAAFVGALVCAVLAAVLAGLLGGCGGGVGAEGTGGVASISSATGPISGFGSIIVNGVHYDESSARVEDDSAQVQDRSVLALGMMVQVTGGAVTTDASGRQVATATSVRYLRSLIGPASQIDTTAGTLVVLGQTVQVQADTVFDSRLSGGLAGLTAGTVLEVYGSYDASTGKVLATRLAPGSSGQTYCVRGVVSAVDTATRTFVIDGKAYSYAGLADTSALVVGALLKVDVQATPDSAGYWVAGGQRSGEEAHGPDGSAVKLEGLVVAFSSTTRLLVDGTVVDIANARVEGTPKVGARVTVSGALQAGVLVAQTLTVQTAGDGGRSFELDGTPTALDTANQRFVVRGVTVSYAGASVQFQGGTAAQLVGYTGRLRVVGLLSADRTVLDATLIRFGN